MGEDNSDFKDFTGEQPYYSKDPATFKEIIVRAFEKCRQEGMKEMTRGGEIKQIINGEVVIKTIPNQRKIFIECVELLDSLMRFHYDKIAEDKMEELYNLSNNLFKQYLESYLGGDSDDNSKDYAKKTNSLPNKIEDQIEKDKLELYRLMFKELVQLFYRKHELSKQRTVGAY